jgi:hypothetical protein
MHQEQDRRKGSKRMKTNAHLTCRLLLIAALALGLVLPGCGYYRPVTLNADLVGQNVLVETQDGSVYDLTVIEVDAFEMLAKSDQVKETVVVPRDEIWEVRQKKVDPLITGIAVGGSIVCAIMVGIMLSSGD